VRVHETVEKDRGRIETRRTVASTELDWLTQKGEWPGLQAVTMVESTRDIGGKVSHERRYYLCSMIDVTRIALTIRHHWTIENQQHWILDVQFGEDAHRTRKDHSEANLGLIRRTALHLLQQDTSTKWSIRRRKMRSPPICPIGNRCSSGQRRQERHSAIALINRGATGYQRPQSSAKKTLTFASSKK